MRAAVVGLGSTLHGDDGVGCAVVGRLRESGGLDGVDLIEAGSQAHLLLDVLASHARVVVVDCAKMGLPAGSVRTFGAEAAHDRRPPARVSAHEGDPFAMVSLSRALGFDAEVTMVAVEPDSMEPGTGLTNAVANAVGTATAAVLKALAGRAEGEEDHDR
jgi:hydrogenase maturation protease